MAVNLDTMPNLGSNVSLFDRRGAAVLAHSTIRVFYTHSATLLMSPPSTGLLCVSVVFITACPQNRLCLCDIYSYLCYLQWWQT